MAWNEVGAGGVWDFEKVSEFEGTIIGAEQVQGNNGKPYTMYTLEESTSGEQFKMWGAVLEGKLSQIPALTKVKITYLGTEKGKGGNSYKNYKVETWSDD